MAYNLNNKLSNENIHNSLNNQVRIAFDGDAVLFSEESELIYKNNGLDAFIEHEKLNKDNPLEMGPKVLNKNIMACENK